MKAPSRGAIEDLPPITIRPVANNKSIPPGLGLSLGKRARYTMYRKSFPIPVTLSAILVLGFFVIETSAKEKKASAKGATGTAVLWREPTDIRSRNLFYGPGGKAHEPRGTFTFKQEDMAGASPKFDVVDQDGVRWRVKMGAEARPETVASRLVWAAGYIANEDYFMPVLHVEKLPHLRRGQEFVSDGNTVHSARLKRHLNDEKKIGSWSWSKNPFVGTREWYGLRVMMAVLNNWDLKTSNNSLYMTKGESPELRYVVSDLGGSFGPTRLDWLNRGDPAVYCASNWIKGSSPEVVDFNVPSMPHFTYSIVVPEMIHRGGMLWIGRNIPRADARWIGNLLGQLSPEQIRDAVRAGGYSSREVEELSKALEARIAELKKF